jgi:hypothetical protein
VISNNTGQLASANSPDVVGAIALPFPVTLGRIPSISFGTPNASFFGFGNYKDYNKNNAIFDNITTTIGRHNLKFGFTYNHYEKSENSASNNAGTFAFAATPSRARLPPITRPNSSRNSRSSFWDNPRSSRRAPTTSVPSSSRTSLSSMVRISSSGSPTSP